MIILDCISAEQEGSTKGTCYAIRTPKSGEEVVKAERSEALFFARIILSIPFILCM
jgi:hypothetical protein